MNSEEKNAFIIAKWKIHKKYCKKNLIEQNRG